MSNRHPLPIVSSCMHTVYWIYQCILYVCTCVSHNIRCCPLCQQSAVGVADLGCLQGVHEVMHSCPMCLLQRQLVALATFLRTAATVTGTGKEEVLSVAKLHPRATPPVGPVLKRRRSLGVQFIDALACGRSGKNRMWHLYSRQPVCSAVKCTQSQVRVTA